MAADVTCPGCAAPLPRPRRFCPLCGTPLREPVNELAVTVDAAVSSAVPPHRRQPLQFALPGVRLPGLRLPAPSRSRHVPRWRLPRSVAIAVAGLLLLLTCGGAAFALPMISVRADTPLAQMLPATTTAYVSFNLRPDGATAQNLQSIERMFTSQPSWSAALASWQHSSRAQTAHNGCDSQVKQESQSALSDFGDSVTLAVLNLTPASSAMVTPAPVVPQWAQRIEQNVVMLIPLHMRLTVAAALHGLSPPLKDKVQTYEGVDIYRQDLTTCDRAGFLPSTAYGALFKDYVLLSLDPHAIMQVVDAGNDTVSRLADSPGFQTLAARLPAASIGSYYVHIDPTVDQGLFSNNALAASQTSPLPPTMGVITIGPHQLRLVSASFNTTAGASAPPAGTIARFLPGNTLGLISLQGLGRVLRTMLPRVSTTPTIQRQSSLSWVGPALTTIAQDMDGETDLVLLHPYGRAIINSRQVSLPLALLWHVRADGPAAQHMQHVLQRLHAARAFAPAATPDATIYLHTPQGYGYAVRNRWMVVSLNIRGMLATLAAPHPHSLARNPSYAAGLPPGIVPSLRWYVNVAGVRRTLETALLPTATPRARSTYQRQVRPFLAPITALTGSMGRTTNGRVSVSTLVVYLGAGG